MCDRNSAPSSPDLTMGQRMRCKTACAAHIVLFFAVCVAKKHEKSATSAHSLKPLSIKKSSFFQPDMLISELLPKFLGPGPHTSKQRADLSRLGELRGKALQIMNQFGASTLINLSSFSSPTTMSASTTVKQEPTMANSTPGNKVSGTAAGGGRTSPDSNLISCRCYLKEEKKRLDYTYPGGRSDPVGVSSPVRNSASHLHSTTSSSGLHAAAPAQTYFVCPVEGRQSTAVRRHQKGYIRGLSTGSALHNAVDKPLMTVLTKKKLHDLVREVDPNEQLDEDVEEMLLQIADDFIESVVSAACQLARHRKSNTLEVKDVQLHLGTAPLV
ncbi:unnamed protein product [Ranitomeya imitator]|uniref:Transcription initiation factor TFIID subunit 12 n=1 Tax=Ranitomeya imitator TaxID=111125 RepID=A0ABN9KPT5_9NEOB|nr:unnamed protein product [Ranitomeya imitator]